MALYLRRLVSGNKARYRDDQLNLELDLAYVTDQIIVMGFPAVGVESFYRNDRADVQRFLFAHHSSDFWVFNFCPLRENAYQDSVFDGRVSRYPFPDHHVPPFLYLQLVTREMHAWLSGSDTRVAVLHCKAGKGRSGTLACAYLLSNHTTPPLLIPDPLHSDWSLVNEKEGLQTPSPDMPVVLPAPADQLSVRAASVPPGANLSRVSSEPLVNPLEKVLDLHTSRRMKHPWRHGHQPNTPKKTKMGVSIPSQQRWLFYWSQALAGNGPSSLQPFSPERCQVHETPPDKTSKVKLTKLTIRMREPSRIQPHLVHAAGMVMTGTGKNRAVSELTAGKLWASLARYNDSLVDELEHWEKESRVPGSATHSSPFKSDQWDQSKMICSFAQMGVSDMQSSRRDKEKPVLSYVLRPLSDVEGDRVKLGEPLSEPSHEGFHQSMSASESSYSFVSPLEKDSDMEGILLDADRELRIRLFIGEVVLGWVWLIPAFHMSPDSPSFNVLIIRDDIDFAIGIGKALVDLKISFVHQTHIQS